MSSLIVKNAALLVTMDGQHREIPDGGLYVQDGFISQVGKSVDLPNTADQVIDVKGHILLPGLINTHHHFFQTLTRAIPAAQNANLFNWLKTLYPIWAKISPDDIYVSTKTALVELAFSGCTTASDHLYLFPNGSALDDEIAAATEIGLRIHASRGSMSLGESRGGLPPDRIVEDEEWILRDCQRVIEKYHNPNPGSMIQIVLAPCSPFSVTGELMRKTAELARHFGVQLHTHLAETEDEDVFCVNKFGYRPVAYMESLDWVGQDVWFAHSIHIHEDEINLYARTGCGIAHCPTSNMRLASGIAPILELVRAGVDIGLGVDGSASNDGSNMLAEARMAMLLARVREGERGFSLTSQDNNPLMTARKALELATIGGAKVLGRTDIGSLEVGKCADFIAINLNSLDFAGGMADPVASLLLCSPQKVDWNVVHGKVIIEEGHFKGLDLPELIGKHNQAASRLLND